MVVGKKDKRRRKKKEEGTGFRRLPFFSFLLFCWFSHNCLFWEIFFCPNLVCFFVHWGFKRFLILEVSNFYNTIFDFAKKNVTQKISKTWRAGEKKRPDLDSAQKTILEMIYLIPWTHGSYFVDQSQQIYLYPAS